MGQQQNEETIRRCVERYNQGTAAWVDEFYGEAADWSELPTPQAPRGRSGGLDALREKAARELALFPDRKMRVLNLIAQNDQVVAELEWRGTSAAAEAGLPPGTAIRMRVASFFLLAGGKIVGHTDYVTSPRRAE